MHPMRLWGALIGFLVLVLAQPLVVSIAASQVGVTLYLPMVYKGYSCPTVSANTYSAGPVFQRDNDNPVRWAWAHADKNLDLRSYAATNTTLDLVNIATDPNEPQPPQFATLFSPNRVPTFTSAHRVYNWNWANPPNPGTRGDPITSWPATALGLQTSIGEALHVPSSAYDLGQGVAAIVIYVDANSITLHYTRDDTAALGYTVHVDNICPDPNLLALYNQLDSSSGPRYTYYGFPDNNLDYNLVTLTTNQMFGTALTTEVRAAIVDSGGFMDPRSCYDWWRIRPGRNCP